MVDTALLAEVAAQGKPVVGDSLAETLFFVL